MIFHCAPRGFPLGEARGIAKLIIVKIALAQINPDRRRLRRKHPQNS